MSVDILGTSWDQCRSMVQYNFTSTETRRLVRTDSPGRPPWLSHSSWTMACTYYWLLLYSAILRCRADSLRSHVILHEWIAFYSAFFCFCFNIHRSVTALAWLVPQETAAISARSVYTIQPCTMSLHAKPHTQGVCVFSCNLPPALLAEWQGSFMCYCSNTGVERIPK